MFFSHALVAAEAAPKGFEDWGLLDRLLKGSIDSKDLVSTAKEIKVLYRAYFDKITAADYLAKVEDHDNYKKVFAEVKDSSRLTQYATGRKYRYKLTLTPSTPIGRLTVKPVLDQEIVEGTTPADESSVRDVVTNLKKEVKEAGLSTRIVPYGDGLLIAHTTQLHLKSYSFLGSAKADFRKGHRDMVQELRDALKANP